MFAIFCLLNNIDSCGLNYCACAGTQNNNRGQSWIISGLPSLAVHSPVRCKVMGPQHHPKQITKVHMHLTDNDANLPQKMAMHLKDNVKSCPLPKLCDNSSIVCFFK